MNKKSALIILLAAMTWAQPLRSQTWDTVAAGLNYNVWGMLSNPNDNLLYIAGAFGASGSTFLNNVAIWDGNAFFPVGPGFNNQAIALALYNNEVYCGGTFTASGSNSSPYIARWDGTQWNDVGGGMDNEVYTLTTYNGQLIAGGLFDLAGGIAAARIARYDGNTWAPLGSGIGGAGTTLVYTMVEYNGLLYVGGQFTSAGGVSVNNIAAWDGSSWYDVGGGVTGGFGFVADMFVYNGELYVTGSFTSAGGNPAISIARWDGTNWSAVGTGLAGGLAYGNVLMVYKGELYLGGNFTFVDGVAANMIARYKNGIWQPLTSGCDQEVATLEVYQDDLYVGGIFIQAGGLNASRIARWNIPCNITTSINASGESCPGTCDGSAQVVVTGTSPFSYLWSTGDTTAALNNLCAGSYTVTVTDSIGCEAVDSVVILSPAVLDVVIQSNNTTCTGACTGKAQALPSGGTPPYTYQWSTSPIQTSATATGLCAGLYVVTVTDNNGCTVTKSVLIEDPVYELTFTTVDPSCPGDCDGQATVFTSSPHGPYSYIWDTNPFQFTQTITGLCAGQYVVIVTDTNFCSVIDTVILNESQYSISISQTSTTCLQACDGTATVTSNSPHLPLTYVWNTTPVQNTATASGLCAGSYQVVVTDASGCVYTGSVQINDPVYTLSFNVTNPSCFQFCDGQATVVSSSPFGPFSYYWNTSPPQTTATATGLCAGNVSVTVTDNNGCAVTGSVLLVDPPMYSLNLTFTDETCPQACDGTAKANPASAYPPFQYFWSTSPVQTTDSVFNLCPGVYTVTVIDAIGCAAVDSVEIMASTLELLFQITPATCAGGCDGEITAIHTGSPPYTYNWITGDTTATISGLCPALYFVTVTDADGCAITGQAQIDIPQPPVVTLTGTQITCAVNCDGQIEASVSGNSPFTYQWNNGATSPVISNLCPGWYVLTVTDAGGCQTTDSLLILPVLPVDITLISSSPATCAGLCDGTALVQASGGAGGPYTYYWSFAQTTSQVVGLCAGTYSVTGFDYLGCPSAPLQVTITEPDPLVITMVPSSASCQTCNDGSIAVTITGGVPPYQYIWSPPVSNPNQLLPGWYFLCVTDNNTCQTCDSAFVDYIVEINDVPLSFNSFILSPNPMHQWTVIRFIAPVTGTLAVSDLSGRVIFRQEVVNQKEWLIYRRQLTAGLYLVSFQKPGHRPFITKLIVQ